MKKQLLIISVLVIIVSVFLSCSVNNSSEDILTIYATDSNGNTHYYEPVTNNKGNISTTKKNQGVFAEIETQLDGKVATKKNGAYVTNDHTTVLVIKDETTKHSSFSDLTTEISSSDNAKSIKDADTVVEFAPTETTEKAKPDDTATTTEKKTTTKTETPTQKGIQPATDKDGWITKWY